MEVFGSVDPYVVLALSMSLLLTLCVAVLFVMRDPEWAPPRRVSRSVWCAARGQHATVDFVEHVETGLIMRSVQRCSLRGPDGRCAQQC